MKEALIAVIGGIVLAVTLFASGFWIGSEHNEGKHAQAALEQKALDDKATKVQKDLDEKKGLENAETIRVLKDQLGDARVKLARMGTGAACLSAPAVSLLNSLGGLPDLPAIAGQPASAPATAAPDPALDARVATDRDVADAIAICRSGYSQLSKQLNDILDIEDRRMNQR